MKPKGFNGYSVISERCSIRSRSFILSEFVLFGFAFLSLGDAVRPEVESSGGLAVSVHKAGMLALSNKLAGGEQPVKDVQESGESNNRNQAVAEPHKAVASSGQQSSAKSSREVAGKAFDSIDHDHDGQLKVSQLKELYARMPEGVSGESVRQLLRKMRGNEDHITKDRFLELTAKGEEEFKEKQAPANTPKHHPGETAKEVAAAIRALADDSPKTPDIDAVKLKDILRRPFFKEDTGNGIDKPLKDAQEPNGKINIDKFAEDMAPHAKAK